MFSFVYCNAFIRRWDVEIQATRAIIQKLNQMEPKPKFFVVCGDIVDAFDCKTKILIFITNLTLSF